MDKLSEDRPDRDLETNHQCVKILTSNEGWARRPGILVATILLKYCDEILQPLLHSSTDIMKGKLKIYWQQTPDMKKLEAFITYFRAFCRLLEPFC